MQTTWCWLQLAFPVTQQAEAASRATDTFSDQIPSERTTGNWRKNQSATDLWFYLNLYGHEYLIRSFLPFPFSPQAFVLILLPSFLLSHLILLLSLVVLITGALLATSFVYIPKAWFLETDWHFRFKEWTWEKWRSSESTARCHRHN